MIGIPNRYLTWRCPGVGGAIKQSIEDFVVTEVPLYRPADRGEHTYFEIEKSDLPTLEAVERIARVLGVPARDVGFAGLKDRRAITRQVLSIAGVPPERILALRLSQIRVLWARLHENKLRVGHLLGNRFRIRVRDCLITERTRRDLAAIVSTIEREGLPNFYGPQRFGVRGDSFWIGYDLLVHDHHGAISRILGRPSAKERNPHVLLARHRFMKGDIDGALEAMPRAYRMERNLLSYFRQAGRNDRGAVKRLPQPVKKIYYSALQSYLFNRVLDRRLEIVGDRPGRLLEGDLAFLHRNGAVYTVRDLEREQPRARAFEVSPSGPLFGKQMPSPFGLERQIEDDVLDELGLRVSMFHQLLPGLQMKGARRPLRVRIRELRWEIDGDDLWFEFFLPKGSYATTFLRELMKADEPAPAFYSDLPENIPVPDELDLNVAPTAEEITGQVEVGHPADAEEL